MRNPRPIGDSEALLRSADRERRLLELFCNCQLEMTPRQFYEKWDVTYEQIAQLCRCDITTVNRWFQRGRHYQPPRHYHKWYLALCDIFLECYEDIPGTLLNRLCLGQ